MALFFTVASFIYIPVMDADDRRYIIEIQKPTLIRHPERQ